MLSLVFLPEAHCIITLWYVSVTLTLYLVLICFSTSFQIFEEYLHILILNHPALFLIWKMFKLIRVWTRDLQILIQMTYQSAIMLPLSQLIFILAIKETYLRTNFWREKTDSEKFFLSIKRCWKCDVHFLGFRCTRKNSLNRIISVLWNLCISLTILCKN